MPLRPGQRQLIKSGTMKTGTGRTHFDGEEDGESVGKYRNIIYRPTGEVCLVFTQLKQSSTSLNSYSYNRPVYAHSRTAPA